MQKCAEAEAAAAQLRQQAESMGAEEARAVLKQLVGQVVSRTDKERRTAAKVWNLFNTTANSMPSPLHRHIKFAMLQSMMCQSASLWST